MDPNDEAAGVFDVIATEEPALAKHVESAPKQTQKTAEAPKTEAKPEQTQKPAKTEEAESDDEAGTDVQDFSRIAPQDDTDDEAENTEPSQTETKTETAKVADEEDSWKQSLPNPPAPYAGKKPEVVDGVITNMTPQEYEDYLIGKAEERVSQRAYVAVVENRALDAAEKILPELKTNPAVRTLVENARVASIINGQQIDAYEAAKVVRDALGLSSTRLAQAKAEGANNAKTSITIQKRSQVESQGAARTKTSTPRADQLAKRLKAGDDEAFVELFDSWEKDGKI